MSVQRVILRIYRREIINTAIIMTIWVAFFILTPLYFLRELINFVGYDAEYNVIGFGIFLALGMMASEAARSGFAHMYWMSASTLGCNLRTLMYAVVYRKAVELRDLSGYTVGELSNLCSNDGQRFFDAATFALFIYTSSIMTIVVVISTALLVGPYAILGCGVYILFLPLQVDETRERCRRAAQSVWSNSLFLTNQLVRTTTEPRGQGRWHATAPCS